MRIAEDSPARLVIEDSGTGFGVVCVLAGHAVVGLAIAKPPWHIALQILEIAMGAAIAAYGALALTRTRTIFDRLMGEISYERRNFFRRQSSHCYYYEVEEVFLERSRERDRFPTPPTQSYQYRPTLRVRGRLWPMGRAFRDHANALRAAQAARDALDQFAAGPASGWRALP